MTIQTAAAFSLWRPMRAPNFPCSSYGRRTKLTKPTSIDLQVPHLLWSDVVFCRPRLRRSVAYVLRDGSEIKWHDWRRDLSVVDKWNIYLTWLQYLFPQHCGHFRNSVPRPPVLKSALPAYLRYVIGPIDAIFVALTFELKLKKHEVYGRSSKTEVSRQGFILAQSVSTCSVV